MFKKNLQKFAKNLHTLVASLAYSHSILLLQQITSRNVVV